MRILPAPPVISAFSMYAVGLEHRLSASSVVAAAAWPVTRRTFYIPLHIPWPIVVRKLFWVNGTSSGNLDVGIYSESAGLPASKLTSTGLIAVGASSTCVSNDITDYHLDAGTYFMAIMVDNATHTMWRATGGGGTMTLKMHGICTETAAASLLPATAVPVAVQTNYIPLFGLTTVTLI